MPTGCIAVGMRRRDEIPAKPPRIVAARLIHVGAVIDEVRAIGRRTELFEQMPTQVALRTGPASCHDLRQPVLEHDRV